jgi:hypothetical protein
LRRIALARIDAVLQSPGQVVPGYYGRNVYQSKYTNARGTEMLLRVVVDESVDPVLVVSVYQTDKVNKYWR